VGSGSADLSITQNDSPDLVHTGDNLTYTLTITNHGPSEATGVTITDTLPPGVTVVSVTPSQGTCTGQSTIMCELEAVASGATATVTLVVQVLPSAGTGGMSNTVSVGNIEPDPDPANNTATVVTTVVTPEGPDLVGSWVKTSGRCREAGTSTVNCKFKGTILVKNQGTRDATNSALRVHRSADSTLDSNDSLLREFGIGNLKVGKGQKRKLKIKFSISPEPPGAYLIAILDVNNAVVEMIEANNQAIVHVALGGVFTVP